jgi:hypothetical protein
VADAHVDEPGGATQEPRLDAEKLDVLRAWGAGLSGDAREEVRAAGRAIELLIEEIDRLYVELWHARDGTGAEPEPAPEPVENVERTLLARLRFAVHKPPRAAAAESGQSPNDPQRST